MSDTEQGDIALKTQQDSDSSDEDIADTQDTKAARGEQRRASQGPGKGNMYQKRRLRKEARKPLFSSEEEMLVDCLHDNEILYKCLMDCKDRSKREAVWDKFCEENYMDKDACQRWFNASAHSSERSLT